jgi:hypothetical protein
VDIFELLLRKIEQEREPYVTTLSSGQARDYADYKHVCGVLRGLNLADEIIRDLAKRSKENADE